MLIALLQDSFCACESKNRPALGPRKPYTSRSNVKLGHQVCSVNIRCSPVVLRRRPHQPCICDPGRPLSGVAVISSVRNYPGRPPKITLQQRRCLNILLLKHGVHFLDALDASEWTQGREKTHSLESRTPPTVLTDSPMRPVPFPFHACVMRVCDAGGVSASPRV